MFVRDAVVYPGVNTAMNTEPYRTLFVNRADAYQQQIPDDSYYCRRNFVDGALLEEHLRGRITCGWFAINFFGRTKWACLDADREDGTRVLQRAHCQLRRVGLHSHLEESREGRGHLWVFTYAHQAEVEALHPEEGGRRRGGGFPEAGHDQCGRPRFRGQGTARRASLNGRALRVPRCEHARTGGHSLGEQLGFLGSVRVNLGREIAEALAEMLTARKSEPRPDARPDLDVVEMASRFTELEDRGSYYLGLCPLHPEKHHSFAVYPNPGGSGRWVCFHDNESGDAIALYARMKQIGYREACEELRE